MEKEKEKVNERYNPHCLILPFPVQGHINPMIQFSKQLAHKGVKITLVTTRYLFKNTQDDILLSSIPVETISDGFDQGGVDMVNKFDVYVDRFQRFGSVSLSELLEKLKHSGCPVDCLIYDSFIPWGLDVAKKYGVLGAAFFTQSCSVNIIYYNLFMKKIKVPHLEKDITLPGLPKLDISDLPPFVYSQEKHPGATNCHVNQFQNIEEADCVFVNSISELEEEATDWLTRHIPLKTIGPSIPLMYLDERFPEDKHYNLSIFKPVNSCIEWLHQRSARSVIYISFGSMAKLDEEQMEELALSLKMTTNYFLWVVRSSEQSKLPINFAQDTSAKGLIVSWSPQLEVLAHDAIGCFVTHCGWNSTLEALSLGVPLVGVPWWADQSMNAKFAMDVWKTGVRARPDEKNVVRHKEIVRCIKLVMEGESGEYMRNNAGKWKEFSREAVGEGGSSDRNIQEFVSTTLMTNRPN